MASGRGIFQYFGDGSVFGSTTDAVLSVSGSGTLEFDEGARKEILPGKNLRVAGVKGNFYIRGSGLSLVIKGFQMDIRTVGNGSACFAGEGHLHRRRPRPESVIFRVVALPGFAGRRAG